MNHDVICAWLELEPGTWPPDHYRLLGLEPGESDPSRIEENVHLRLDTVRRYQLTYPEPATEALNRLAQAFVCLTDPPAKQAYDAQLFANPPRLPVPPPLPRTCIPPPLPLPPQPPASPEGKKKTKVQLDTPSQPPPLPTPPLVLDSPAFIPPKPPADPLAEVMASACGPIARRGLQTRHRLHDRRVQTHRLLRNWRRIGELLETRDKTLDKRAATDLLKLVTRINGHLEGFPHLFGEAGRPGYMLLTLTEMDSALDLVKLDCNQLESLQRDWERGMAFLYAHRDLLRRELRKFRRHCMSERIARNVSTYLSERMLATAAVAVAIVLVVLGLAYCVPLR
jgi:hypothetical protein